MSVISYTVVTHHGRTIGEYTVILSIYPHHAVFNLEDSARVAQSSSSPSRRPRLGAFCVPAGASWGQRRNTNRNWSLHNREPTAMSRSFPTGIISGFHFVAFIWPIRSLHCVADHLNDGLAIPQLFNDREVRKQRLTTYVPTQPYHHVGLEQKEERSDEVRERW